MKSVMRAYFKLRKSWLVVLYAIIIFAGITSTVNDSMQWHKWSAGIDKWTSKKEYQATRDYLKTHPKVDVYDEGFPKNYSKYIELMQLVTPVSEQKDCLTPKNLYQYAPKSYHAFKKSLLQYYQRVSYAYNGVDWFVDVEHRGFSIRQDKEPYTNIAVSINKVALMGQVVSLVFVGLYGLLLLLDHVNRITPFIKSRTGGVNQLTLAQFIYWLVIPLGLTVGISLMTHLTRSLFIPADYITIPWHNLIKQGVDSLSIAIMIGLSITFINALVGKIVYKILTLCLAFPTLLIGYSNLSGLLNLSSVDHLLQFPSYVFLLMFIIVFVPIIIALQKGYSVEQDTAYIKLKKLRLPFYVTILIFVFLDGVLSIFMDGLGSSPVIFVLLVCLVVVVPIVFAKLVLNKDIRNLFHH